MQIYNKISIFEIMRLSYKYKTYRLNENRKRKIERIFSLSCWVYNHSIALHKRYYRLFGKHLHANKLKVHLAKLKKQEKYNPWNELSSQTIQAIVEKIDEGYKKFFRKENKRPPTFRKRKKYNSVLYKNTGWRIKDNEFVISKQNIKIKYHSSRPLDGDIATVTLKRDALGDFFLCFSLKNIAKSKKEKQSTTGKIAGFDFGLKTFLVSSEGENYFSPEFLKKASRELAKKSKNLSRKDKSSKSRAKARIELGLLHRTIGNKREDYHWKLAHEISDRYDILCFEDLHIKAMQRLWGRKIGDYGFSNFLVKLNHVCEKKGKKLIKIDRFYPSSKTCGCCGHIKKDLTLKDRFWTCENCGADLERDLNAAKYIKKVGASTLEGELVRPALAG